MQGHVSDLTEESINYSKVPDIYRIFIFIYYKLYFTRELVTQLSDFQNELNNLLDYDTKCNEARISTLPITVFELNNHKNTLKVLLSKLLKCF